MKKLGKTEKSNNYRIRFNFPFFLGGGDGYWSQNTAVLACLVRLHCCQNTAVLACLVRLHCCQNMATLVEHSNFHFIVILKMCSSSNLRISDNHTGQDLMNKSMVEDGPLEILEKGLSYASWMESGIVLREDYSMHEKTRCFQLNSPLKPHLSFTIFTCGYDCAPWHVQIFDMNSAILILQNGLHCFPVRVLS